MNYLPLNEINPQPPSYIFGYWRPWNETSNFFESYLDYTKDKTLAKYSSDIIGKYISSASNEQVRAINNLSNNLGNGFNFLAKEFKSGLSNINESINRINDNLTWIQSEITFVNRNFDLLLQQQKVSQYLLLDITKLLKIPDTEKERAYYIDKGITFFVNAAKNASFYEDSVEMFLKAKYIFRQDYFVLHKLGYIYLYAENHINPSESINYFLEAAKYASLEIDKDPISDIVESRNISDIDNKIDVKSFIADCYDKAAFGCYVIGNFSDAVKYQEESLKFNKSTIYKFNLSKYQVRNNETEKSIKTLSEVIEEDSNMVSAVLHDIDLMNSFKVIELLESKNKALNDKISALIANLRELKSLNAESLVKSIKSYDNSTYSLRMNKLIEIESDFEIIKDKKLDYINRVNFLINVISNSLFIRLSVSSIYELKNDLIKSTNLNLEEMIDIYENINEIIQNEIVKVGSDFEGGIVFYLDKSERHGLVAYFDKTFKAIWGTKNNQIGTSTEFGKGKDNTLIISQKASSNEFKISSRKYLFFKQERIITESYNSAANICLNLNLNGFNDWYLPSLNELICLSSSIDNSWKKKLPFRIWSSSEKNISKSYYLSFKSDKVGSEDKQSGLYFIPIRAF